MASKSQFRFPSRVGTNRSPSGSADNSKRSQREQKEFFTFFKFFPSSKVSPLIAGAAIAGAALAMVGLGASTASAAIILGNDGSTVAGNTGPQTFSGFADGDTASSFWSQYQNGTMQVTSTVPDPFEASGGKSFEFTTPSQATFDSQAQALFTSTSQTAGDGVVLTMDFVATGSSFLALNGKDALTGASINGAYLNIDTSGNVTTAEGASLTTLTIGKWYELQMTPGSGTNYTYDVGITPYGGSTSTYTGLSYGDPASTDGINMTIVQAGIYWNSTQTNTDVSNIEVTTVPEPATLGLTALGGLGILLLGRKRRIA